jgi:glycosyltransferase involved in cell wall biosynthesis
MKRIRVLEIISGFAVEGPLGGVERFGIGLAQALDTTRYEPIVCGLWAYGTPFEYNWVDMLLGKGIRAFVPADWDEEHPYVSFVRAYRNALEIMDGEKVDIIHSHCQFGDVLALLLRRRLQAKALVRTVHNEREWGRRPLRRMLLTGLLYPLRFDRELGVSRQVVDNLDQRLIARLRRMRAIRAYNALELNRFENIRVNRRLKKAQLGIPEDAPVVGAVGRLTEQKGYDILLQSTVTVLQEYPTVYFLIVGGGKLEDTLRRQTHQLSVSERVLLTGPRNDVEELFAIMDVFVNSSLWEGLPTTLLESMVAGVPIVATNVSGSVELIQHEISGLLVPPSDSSKLAQALLSTLNASTSVLDERRRQARDFAQKYFSMETIAEQHDAIYTELVDRG